MRVNKTRKVTEMGRLVTRQQLQSAANQIGAAVANALRVLEEQTEARLARIEKELGLPPIDAKPALVADEPSPKEVCPKCNGASFFVDGPSCEVCRGTTATPPVPA